MTARFRDEVGVNYNETLMAKRTIKPRPNFISIISVKARSFCKMATH